MLQWGPKPPPHSPFCATEALEAGPCAAPPQEPEDPLAWLCPFLPAPGALWVEAGRGGWAAV